MSNPNITNYLINLPANTDGRFINKISDNHNNSD